MCKMEFISNIPGTYYHCSVIEFCDTIYMLLPKRLATLLNDNIYKKFTTFIECIFQKFAYTVFFLAISNEWFYLLKPICRLQPWKWVKQLRHTKLL